jgi:hypothetical protein
VPPGSLTACVVEVDGPTTPSGGPPARPMTSSTSLSPRAATTTPASPFMPCDAPMTSASTSTPRVAPTIPPAASSVTRVSPSIAQPVPHRLPTGVVPISPMVHPHPMRTQGVISFQQPKLYDVATLSPVPKSVRVILANPHWWVAMEEEYATLMSNDTWDMVPCLHDANVATDKWIFKHKFKVDVTLNWYKACWVLHGFTHHPNVDYDETFSHVMKPVIVRTIYPMLSPRIGRSTGSTSRMLSSMAR